MLDTKHNNVLCWVYREVLKKDIVLIIYIKQIFVSVETDGNWGTVCHRLFWVILSPWSSILNSAHNFACYCRPIAWSLSLPEIILGFKPLKVLRRTARCSENSQNGYKRSIICYSKLFYTITSICGTLLDFVKY